MYLGTLTPSLRPRFSMKLEDGSYLLSPTDLADHLVCRHLTSLSRRVARGELRRPRDYDPRTEVLFERGRLHEQEYLEWLRGQGLRVEVVDRADGSNAAEATVELMQSGVDVIAQGTLARGRWRGRADVLQRTARASDLGPWSYEVTDTKLARETKGTSILQLCAYSDLLGQLQGLRPERMYVVSPGRVFEREVYRVDDFGAYFRRVRARLEAVLEIDSRRQVTYPDPVEHCDVCGWWRECQQRRRSDDHLCLVAGMSLLHRTELQDWGVATRASLAALPLPIDRKPARGSRAAYERLREQARLQMASPAEGPPRWERLPVEEGHGLTRLPRPSPGDVFLDLEGDPFVGMEGQEYLVGWVTAETKEPDYHSAWALDRREERIAFERLVDLLMARWERWPEFHAYHYTPYEPGALKRLMGRHGTRENEVDRLLRGKRFVDLYGVLRQGLRVGVERYSIKEIEPLYGYRRSLELHEASRALLRVELALEREIPEEIQVEDRERVESYNRDDCHSALRLRDWLEEVRAQVIAGGEPVPRPPDVDPEPSERLSEWQEKVRSVREQLHGGVPDDPEERSDEEHARWLLGHLLEFHRREAKVDWWEFFRLAATPAEERYDEPKAIAGLAHERRIDRFGKNGRKLLPIDRYTFPTQEVEERSKEARIDEATVLGAIEGIDGLVGWIEIRKRKSTLDEHPPSLFMFSRIQEEVLEKSLLRLGEWVAENGIDAPGRYRAARDLLLRRRPRLSTGGSGSLRDSGEPALAAGRRLGAVLEGGVLPIQGPPGSGKTYTGARMILDLVRAGKRVGITALSHKVIRNLLDETVEAAEGEGLDGLRCVQKIGSDKVPAAGKIPIEETTDNDRVLEALDRGDAQVAAGTAWLWAREPMADSVDVLFVDEAAQLSLATTLAAAQAAGNLVLIGDPQQLEQPIQGAHPLGTGAAALDHLLGEHPTVPDDRGLFLGETFRLHPRICRFTSALYYEGRLDPRPENSRQGFHAPAPVEGSGLYFLPVEHRGNQSASQEETAAIGDLVEGWLAAGAEWTDKDGARHALAWENVLILAPYNLQVSRLKSRLPDACVGTVDKFQGQQAPVVVYSMTSSSPEDAPRGIEFLFSRHRLNVATSRAQCAVVLVANPRLLEPVCRTPRQMRLANGLCAFVEQAKVMSVSAE